MKMPRTDGLSNLQWPAQERGPVLLGTGPSLSRYLRLWRLNFAIRSHIIGGQSQPRQQRHGWWTV